MTVVNPATVDTATVGTYTRVYRATDSAGKVGSATRTIIVVAKDQPAPPVITLVGAALVRIEAAAGETFPVDATATDQFDGSLTSSIVRTGSVDDSVLGEHVLTCKSYDCNVHSLF